MALINQTLDLSKYKVFGGTGFALKVQFFYRLCATFRLGAKVPLVATPLHTKI
jgi:hypothetical protein